MNKLSPRFYARTGKDKERKKRIMEVFFQEYNRKEMLGSSTDQPIPSAAVLEPWFAALAKQVEENSLDEWTNLLSSCLKQCNHPICVSWNLVRTFTNILYLHLS